MRFLSGRQNHQVAIVGLGYIGSCIAAVLAERGHDVVGVDTNTALITELGDGYCRFVEPGLAELLADAVGSGRLTVTTDYSAVRSADVVLVTVGTPVREDGSLADEQLRGACTELAEHVREGQLYVVKSTVPPGTTRELVLPLLEASGLVGGVDFGLAFTPERLAEGTALGELRTLPIVAGGLGTDSTSAAAEFWRTALGVEVVVQESLEAAEIIKLADNWWIDLNIALGNELAKFCTLFGVDVLDVITAANMVPKGTGNVNILLPSIGVGGSCLTKDPWMVWRSARERGLDILTAPAGRRVNADMPDYTAGIILEELIRLGKEPAMAKVTVIGLAFKNNTGDLRHTPTQPAIAVLEKVCAEVTLYDPRVDADEADELFGITPSTRLEDAVKTATASRSSRCTTSSATSTSPGCP